MSSSRVAAELTGLGFPEALRWHGGALWFSDMFRSKVIRWEIGKEPETILDKSNGGPHMPGGLGWTAEGNLLVVDCLEKQVLLHKNDQVTTFADLSDFTQHPLNDMHVDSDGTAWVGGYGFDPAVDTTRESSLFKISPSGEITLSEAKFVFPNGCERGQSLVVAETFADRVSFFDDEFNLISRYQLEEGSGPDGLSISPKGELFVAMAFSSELRRLDEEGPVTIFSLSGLSPENPKGIFDCAHHPTEQLIAFSSACLDEDYSLKHDTGSITLVSLDP
jgi:sugar lactone lactonase YvrE